MDLATRRPEAGEASFDAEPSFEAERPVPERDPFPAFYWAPEPRGEGTFGVLEVLVGRDTVVFHQAAITENDRGGGAAAVRELEKTGWAVEHPSPAALFTAEFTQVSSLGEGERADWSTNLDHFEHRSAAFRFHGINIAYDLLLGIGQDRTGARLSFHGLILLERAQHEGAGEGDRASSVDLHLDASSFINHLATLLICAAKVEAQHELAQSKLFPRIEEGLHRQLAAVERERQTRARTVASPFSRSEIEKLQSVHRGVRKDQENADQLVDTCQRNTRHFDDFRQQLLHNDDPWVRRTLWRLRGLVDGLQALRRKLETQARWLEAEIELLLATGGQFSSEYTRMLVRFVGPEAALAEELKSFPPLVTSRQISGGPRTVWLAGDPEVLTSGGETLLVTRPKEISSERCKALSDLYLEALGECSPERLRTLLGYLGDRNGRLRFAGSDPEQPLLAVPVGRLFCRGTANNLRMGHPWGSAQEFQLPNAGGPFSDVYVRASREAPTLEVWHEDEDWVGLVSLIAFLEGVSRFLANPPTHLASVAQEYSVERSRFVFAAGYLYAVAGRSDEATGCLQEAAHLALVNQDFEWAYWVAQLLQGYESKRRETSGPEKASAKKQRDKREVWRERLAGDFLKVYDLGAAVGLARAGLPSHHGNPFQRPKLHGLLWGLAILVAGALLFAESMVSPILPRWLPTIPGAWRERVLILATACAILGAPLALGLGARGGLRRLFPNILLPRMLGAVTLATITFCASAETALLSAAGPSTFGIVVVISLMGGMLYMYYEVRRRVGPGRESVRRCLNVFSLVFLEAVFLSTIFVLVYGPMFSEVLDKHGPVSQRFKVHDIFIRPGTIFLVAVLAMFVGIVVQLMIQAGDKPREEADK